MAIAADTVFAELAATATEERISSDTERICAAVEATVAAEAVTSVDLVVAVAAAAVASLDLVVAVEAEEAAEVFEASAAVRATEAAAASVAAVETAVDNSDFLMLID